MSSVLRVKVGNVWITGEPFAPLKPWSPALNPLWSPQRPYKAQGSACWGAAVLEDQGPSSHVLTFRVSREFSDIDEAAGFEWAMSLMSLNPPHAHKGTVTLRRETAAGEWTETILDGALVRIQSIVPVGQVSYDVSWTILAGVTTQGDRWGYTGIITEDGIALTTEDGSWLLTEEEGSLSI